MLSDELLLQVSLDPRDDDLKRVCADALLSQGHEWGELINLQLSSVQTAASRARERELLTRATSWLPRGMRVVLDGRTARWEKGFLVACAVIGSDAQVAESAMHPLWATVRDLHGAPATLLAGCPHLESWTGVGAEALLHAEVPSSLKKLGLYWPTSRSFLGQLVERIEALATQGLEELHLADADGRGWRPCSCCLDEDQVPEPGPFDPRDFTWLPRVSRSLTVLRLYNGYTHLADWLMRFAAVPVELSTLAFRPSIDVNGALDSDWELELSSTRPGEYRSASVHRANSFFAKLGQSPDALVRMLRTLPEGWFSDLALRDAGWARLRHLPCFSRAKVTRR